MRLITIFIFQLWVQLVFGDTNTNKSNAIIGSAELTACSNSDDCISVEVGCTSVPMNKKFPRSMIENPSPTCYSSSFNKKSICLKGRCVLLGRNMCLKDSDCVAVSLPHCKMWEAYNKDSSKIPDWKLKCKPGPPPKTICRSNKCEVVPSKRTESCKSPEGKWRLDGECGK